MNRIFFITFVAISVLFSFETYAQNENRKDGKHFDKEAFKARRNAFLIAEIGLTPEEASSFIPIYDEYQQKMFEAGQECRRLSRDVRHKEKPVSEDYTKAINACVHVRAKEAELEKEYHEKFSKILTPEKVFKYRIAEHKFAKSFMRESGKKDTNKAK